MSLNNMKWIYYFVNAMRFTLNLKISVKFVSGEPRKVGKRNSKHVTETVSPLHLLRGSSVSVIGMTPPNLVTVPIYCLKFLVIR